MAKNDFRNQVRRQISQHAMRKDQLWATFQSHSEAYAKALGLDANDLAELEDSIPQLSMYSDLKEVADQASVLNIEVDGDDFVISCKHVCGAAYGGQWGDYLFGICVSDPSLNTEHGYGTTRISVLPDDVHKKLCERLEEGSSDEKSQ